MSKDPYRRSAKWYDALFEPLNAGLRQIGLKMWPPQAGLSVLDVGCGTGTHLDLYQQAGCQVYGIDSSPAMLEMARQKLGQHATLDLGDASQLPYPDGTFDLVMITLTLHEMLPATRTAVLSEIQRVIKKSGRILIIDYHPGPIRFIKGWLFKGLITLIELWAGRDHFRNYRDFLAHGGVPALSQRPGLLQAGAKIVTGGNLGLFLLRRG
ncbi:MAG: class I SAM-dependent methyltransferase [Fidelibacterota bacterium]|nr:MAG: class I SAM-dependent methyltransferase [Candidatus Neomarinimicrobiota bacterium]